ncbi:hypothetical protein NL676_007219 [Syzygium grande]|nr:hypothetical protein NL676_007219 [Syzygium grande]
MVDCDGCTALHIAVLCGRIRMVKALVRSNPNLTQLPDNTGRVPLGISAVEASMHKEIAWFLAENTTDHGPSNPFSSPSAIDTIISLTYAGHHDITLYLVGRYSHLLTMRRTQNNRSILGALSRMESHFPSGTRLTIMEALIYKCIPMDLNYKPTNENSDPALQYLTKSLWNAAKIVVPIIKRMHKVKMRHVAAVELAEQVCIAISPAAYKPHLHAGASVPGAAFQLQRELQWFKAVESWLLPAVRTEYHDDKRYWNIFVEKHKTLLENAEKWVKDTANSCMLVSTLIATVLFAAAFTVPGGNDNITGVPLLLGEDSFLVFAISDALGLFSSVTAILLFLAILTSRYEAQDFLESLPKKIIMGLSLLFLSLAFMLVAFAATLAIVLHKRVEWVLIPITLLASVPVALFAILQLPLLFQMVRSTYGPSIFHPESI